MANLSHFRTLATWLVLSLGCTAMLGAAETPRELRSALESITADDLLRDTRRLAGDDFEGRAPGTPGEAKTVAYLIEQFRGLGLKPGNPDGTWTQNVPLVGITAQDPSIAYFVGDQRTDLAFPGECVVWSKRFVSEVNVERAEVVFVGYGVVAPEYQWDDFKDVDVRGKTIVMLINDPPVPSRSDPEKLDPRVFQGRAMTYYGRWTYKFEIAARKGAAAAIIVHEQGPAGYPWFVVVGSNSRENFDLQAPHKNLDRVAVEGWIHLDKARKLFAAGGYDFDTLKRRAIRRDFRPVPLGVRASFGLRNRLRDVNSQNVAARLEGSDPKLKDECVILTAHWDHLGKNPKLEGDQIFNGALDNAGGVAELLALARGFTRLPSAPKRSLVFLSVTAEEKGLLGAKYYAEHPLYPLERTAANLNIDTLNPWGRTRDVEVIGQGNTTLEDLLATAAHAQGRVVTADSEPEKGRFYRSDHFEFAKVGVPALYLKGGIDYVDRQPDYGLRKIEAYTSQDYHKVSDEVKPDWDLAGAAEDTQLLFRVGWAVAQDKAWPEWKAGSEFKARRTESLRSNGARLPKSP